MRYFEITKLFSYLQKLYLVPYEYLPSENSLQKRFRGWGGREFLALRFVFMIDR